MRASYVLCRSGERFRSRSPRKSRRLLRWSDLQLTGTVAKLVLINADLVEHTQKQIGHRRMLRELEVPAALQFARCATSQHDRQRIVIVLIRVAHAAAVKDHRMVQ